METSHKVNLTSAEVANLWSNYMQDSMAICVFEHYLATVEDTEIKSVLEYAMHLSKQHIETVTKIFNEERIPIPDGFTTMFHVSALNSVGVGYYGASLGIAMRRDLGSHYYRLLTEIVKYAEDGANIMIKHRWMEKPPHAPDQQAIVEGINRS